MGTLDSSRIGLTVPTEGEPNPRISSIEAVDSFLTLDDLVSLTLSALETLVPLVSLVALFFELGFYLAFKKFKASSKEKALLSTLLSSF